MKISNRYKDYDELMKLPVPPHRKPRRPTLFWQTLTHLVSIPDLKKTDYSFREVGMERLGKNEPALILMNHSSFLDFEIAYYSLYPRKFNTVATFDAFIDKDWLLRQIGCFPTRKFITDLQLIRDIKYCIEKNKTSVLMYPEAGYTFDGTKTTMPSTVASLVKMLGVPLCMLEAYGSFLRDPMYNRLQNRRVKVRAELRYVLSPEEIAKMSVGEIESVLEKEFSYDEFRRQKEEGIVINEPFRADGLESVLYKCPHCGAEGKMHGEGITLTCTSCKKEWELTELGELRARDGETRFSHIPDWNKWQRECVRDEIVRGEYGYTEPVDIYMIVNFKGAYRVGDGTLTHDENGFHLVGCDGRLDYKQSARSMYTCESAFYWYQMRDVIGMGDKRALYFAMPKERLELSAKTRLAVEEMFKIIKNQKA